MGVNNKPKIAGRGFDDYLGGAPAVASGDRR